MYVCMVCRVTTGPTDSEDAHHEQLFEGNSFQWALSDLSPDAVRREAAVLAALERPPVLSG